ncbi:MAG: TRAM domain-containing protein [Leptospiraceae bacterium]|nr:TRAM domain-containing protein [Leptospiraceae bacterium]
MSHLYKIIASLLPSLLVFGALFVSQNDLISAVTYSVLTLLLSLLIAYTERQLFYKFNAEAMFCMGVGLFLGLASGFFLSQLFSFLKEPGLFLIFHGFFAFIGVRAGFEFSLKPGLAIFGGGKSDGIRPFNLGVEKDEEEVRDKILDTSVVIDGRILDIADTHFIDGPLILPNFVLREIQLISDSSDPIKRARGRRGLDMLNKLQRKGSIEVKITYTDYTDTREVDAKLIKLARDTGAKLVTNDFNLNKVAELQGVKVLNLNNLANALKPVVLPGEEFSIQVIKEGKDEDQGIGYLEDGTMVVIENGGHLVGKEVKVTVTSIIQTAAGKMIFTKVTK